jgi:hypothetical protein
MGFFGGLVMSAIKRDRGVKDWGHMIEGHGGMLDRLDSGVLRGADLLPPHRYLERVRHRLERSPPSHHLTGNCMKTPCCRWPPHWPRRERGRRRHAQDPQ